MCLIVFAPCARRARISKSLLENGFRKNSDGAGFAYASGNEIHISKAYLDFETFWAACKPFLSSNGPLLIHFRYGTKGSNCARNTQPLVVRGKKLVMAHNGMLHGLSQCEEDVSDSVKLARLIRRMGWTVPFKRAQLEMLEGLCFGNSKLVFLAPGRYTIVNEGAGVWMRGAWYSDKKVKPATPWKAPKQSRLRKIIQTKLPMGTRYDAMTPDQKARVSEWETAFMRASSERISTKYLTDDEAALNRHLALSGCHYEQWE